MENLDQKQIEIKWQKLWQENKVFEPKINENQEKFVATVAYPYANSVMHIGHGRTNTMADIIARYQRLKGKNVLFPMGFHITGTPVLAVADAISKGEKKQIEMTRDAISDYIKDKKEQDKLLESFKDPFEIANFFSSKIEETFNSIGISIDWSRQFTTGDKQYNKFIEWQYKKLKEAGILVQGKYPILYSVKDKNAVGEDDIKDGDTDKVTIQEMNYILFKLEDKDKYIAIATLRPDALFGATNLWVGNDIDLVEITLNNKKVIIAKQAYEKFYHQFENIKLENEFKGNKLLNKNVLTPITNRRIPIADGSTIIDPKHGTGIVYSSPAGAPHDYITLMEAKKTGKISENIEIINTVETYDKKKNKIEYKGSCPAEDKCIKFKIESSNDLDKLELAKQELYKEEHFGGILNKETGEFKGLPIKHAKEKVFEKLKELKLGGILYETSRRATTRAGDEVIVAVLDKQWFLDYSKPQTKEKAFKVLDNLSYNPNSLRSTQKSYLEWVEMRPCARKRGLGTKLPYDKEWVIEALSDSTIYQMYYFLAKIINEKKINSQKLIPEVFDYTLLGQGNIDKISDKSQIKKEILKEMRTQTDYWKNIDLRYTGGAHMSNHLSFLIYHYGLIFPQKNWPKNITIGGFLIKDGEKISKSKGNGIPLFRMKDVYGVDLYRLYIAVGSNYDVEMDFKDDDVFQLEKKFNRLKELWTKSINKKQKEYKDFSTTNKWLISRFYSRINDFFELFDNMRIREAYVNILYEFLSEISYHERRTSLNETLEVIRFILKDYILIMASATPHICEEIFSKLEKNSYVSTSSFETKPNDFIDKISENHEAIIENLVTQITRLKEQNPNQIISKIKIIQASDERFKLFDKIKYLLEQTREFKKIMPELLKDFSQEKKFIQKFVPKTLGEGISFYLSKQKEKELIELVKTFLEKEFNAKIELTDVKKENFNLQAIVPAKPGIIFE